MNAQDFAMWLNGYIELGGERPSEPQWQMIKEHLALVFKKETKNLSDFTYCSPTVRPEISIPTDKITC